MHRPEDVARALLGKVLVRAADDGARLTARIVEVEAYCGLDDPAAHTFGGKTARNEVLFGPPGYAYVYFIYGMYYCLNFSCEPAGKPGGVLIRALEPVEGLEQMRANRESARGFARGLAESAKDSQDTLLTNGPGRLCQAMAITRANCNGLDVTDASSALWVGTDGFEPEGIEVTPRIGIRKAVDWPLRFLIAGNRFVSRAKAARSLG